MLDYKERVSRIFDRIDSVMNRLESCFQGPPCNKIMERYQAVQAAYPVAEGNLVSYSDDFITLINRMRENDKYLSGLFQGFTEDKYDKAKTDLITINKKEK